MGRAAFGLGLWIGLSLGAGAHAASATSAPGPRAPTETADAVLIDENVAWPRILHDAAGLPAWLDVALDQRTRFEFLDEPFRPGEADTQSQYPQRTRLRIGADAPAGVRFLAELQDSRTWGEGPDDFTGAEIDKLSFAQLFASWTQRDLLGTPLRVDLHGGRMSLDFGSRRLVGRNNFRNTTNAFDGVHAALAHPEGWRVRAFWSRPVQLDPDYFENESDDQQRLWGAMFEDGRCEWLQLDVYYFGLHDRLGGAGSLERSYHTVGARALRQPKPAQWDYELEAMGQFGDRTLMRAGVPTELDHEAYGVHAELGYTFAVAWSPRLVAQFDYASGTADPDGDESHTFDPLFGTRGGDMAVTGIFGPFRRANVISPGLRLQVVPRPGWKAFVKVRYWELAQEKDAFVGNGLVDPTGASGDELGTDVEVGVSWAPRSWLTIEAGYDHWWKGSYLRRVPTPSGAISDDDSDYLYLSVRFRI